MSDRMVPDPPRAIPYPPWMLMFVSWFCYSIAAISLVVAVINVWSDWQHALWDNAVMAGMWFYVGQVHSWLYGWERWSRQVRAAVLSGRA